LAVIITFVLFAVALFAKGFTHDLLLEAGVLLVSVKLILMAYRNTTAWIRPGTRARSGCDGPAFPGQA